MLQVIVFSFSKKECEKLAISMISLDLTDKNEKELISSIYNNAVECLSQVPLVLLQRNDCTMIRLVLPMSRRMIAGSLRSTRFCRCSNAASGSTTRASCPSSKRSSR